LLFSFYFDFCILIFAFACDGTLQALGVNGTAGVDCTHMNPVSEASGDEGLQKEAVAGATRSQTTSPRSLLGYTVLAVGIALFIRFFIAAPYIVDGPSMEPTFYGWHYLIVDKLVYDIHPPERGDVVVFGLPQDTGRSLIKRVIGLPGETVRITGSEVRIISVEYPQGLVLDEPYIDPKNASSGEQVEIQLGPDEYFVLGDNRRVSLDSRFWGKLPFKDIAGRVDLRLFPFNKIGVLPGEFRYQ